MTGGVNFSDPAYVGNLVKDISLWNENQINFLLAPAETMALANLTPARYHQYIIYARDGTMLDGINLRINNSGTDTDYAFGRSINGAADTTSTNTDNFIETGVTSGNIFMTGWLTDNDIEAKLLYMLEVDTQGNLPAVAPRRATIYGKADITGGFVTDIEARNSTAGQNGFNLASLINATSISPQTLDSRPFWSSAGEVVLETAGTILTNNFITSSFLWITFHTRTNGSHELNMRINGNSGANYSMRFKVNEGAETTLTSQNEFQFYTGATGNDVYGSLFLTSGLGDVTLVTGMLCQTVDGLSSTAPTIVEFAGKFTVTDQITSISILDTVNMLVGTKMRIWGA